MRLRSSKSVLGAAAVCMADYGSWTKSPPSGTYGIQDLVYHLSSLAGYFDGKMRPRSRLRCCKALMKLQIWCHQDVGACISTVTALKSDRLPSVKIRDAVFSFVAVFSTTQRRDVPQGHPGKAAQTVGKRKCSRRWCVACAGNLRLGCRECAMKTPWRHSYFATCESDAGPRAACSSTRGSNSVADGNSERETTAAAHAMAQLNTEIARSYLCIKPPNSCDRSKTKTPGTLFPSSCRRERAHHLERVQKEHSCKR